MPRLTPNEAALYRLLQANRGRAVPRAQLLAGVGWPPEVRTRTLDVHIQHLRRKLGPTARIETVFKVGYRLAG